MIEAYTEVSISCIIFFPLTPMCVFLCVQECVLISPSYPEGASGFKGFMKTKKKKKHLKTRLKLITDKQIPQYSFLNPIDYKYRTIT